MPNLISVLLITQFHVNSVQVRMQVNCVILFLVSYFCKGFTVCVSVCWSAFQGGGDGDCISCVHEGQ